jgi:hypothetical protein
MKTTIDCSVAEELTSRAKHPCTMKGKYSTTDRLQAIEIALRDNAEGVNIGWFAQLFEVPSSTIEKDLIFFQTAGYKLLPQFTEKVFGEFRSFVRVSKLPAKPVFCRREL